MGAINKGAALFAAFDEPRIALIVRLSADRFAGPGDRAGRAEMYASDSTSGAITI